MSGDDLRERPATPLAPAAADEWTEGEDTDSVAKRKGKGVDDMGLEPLTLTSQPRRHPDVAAGEVDDRDVIGHEALGRLVVLDPLTTLLWRGLDGTTSIRALAMDLAAGAAIDGREAEVFTLAFANALARDGFLVAPVEDLPPPRRTYYDVPVESCLGLKLGLAQAHLCQVAQRGPSFRFGATASGIVDQMSPRLSTEARTNHFLETILLRISGRRTSSRIQHLYDTFGNLLWLGQDHDTAIEALHRTVAARSQIPSGGAWSECLAFERDNRVVMVHKHFVGRLAITGRAEMTRKGIQSVPSGFMALGEDGKLHLPEDPFLSRPGISMELGGIVVPHRDREAPADEFRFALHLARTWDQTHFDWFLRAFRDGAVHTAARGATTDEVTDLIAEQIAA